MTFFTRTLFLAVGIVSLAAFTSCSQDPKGIKTYRFEDLVGLENPSHYAVDSKANSPFFIRLNTNQNNLHFVISQRKNVLYDSSEGQAFWQGRVPNKGQFTVSTSTRDFIANTQLFPYFLEVDRLPNIPFSSKGIRLEKQKAQSLRLTVSKLIGNPPKGYGYEHLTYLSHNGNFLEHRLLAVGNRLVLRNRVEENPQQVWFEGAEFIQEETHIYPSMRLWDDQLDLLTNCQAPDPKKMAIPDSMLRIGSRLLLCQPTSNDSPFSYLVRQRLGGALPDKASTSIPLKNGSQVLSIIWTNPENTQP